MLKRAARSVRQSSLFRRLMLSFAGVIVGVALIGLLWVFYEAKATQRSQSPPCKMSCQ